MNKPLFEVGEEVILQNIKYPECNGEYRVEVIRTNGETYTDRKSGRTLQAMFKHGEYGYSLCIARTDERGSEEVWAEKALRKKYDGSEFSFNELMNVLNNPVQLPQHIES